MGKAVLLRIILGAVVGGLAGFGLNRWVGCSGGGCPIMSNPWLSLLFGMAIGAFVAAGR